MNEEEKNLSPSMKVFVVGGKPLKKRKVAKKGMAKILLLSVLIDLGFGNGIYSGLEKTGISAEITNYFYPIDEDLMNSISIFNEKIQWIEHESPWIDIGKTEQGYNLLDMLNSWSEASEDKLETEDLLFIYSQAQFMMPTLVGRDDPKLVEYIKQEAIIAEMTLNENYPHMLDGLKEIAAKRGNREKLNNEEAIVFSSPNYIDDINKDMRYSYSQAKDMLEKTIQITGFKSLQLPIEYWNNPNRMATSAGVILNAQDDFKQSTGLDGKALGIDGRINLRLKIVPENLSLNKDDGRTMHGTMLMRRDGIFIDTNWNGMFHEIVHAYDVLVSVEGYKNPNLSFFSEENAGLARRSDYPGFVRQSRLSQQVLNFDNEALGDLGGVLAEQAKMTSNTKYWQSKPEIFARGFESFVSSENARIMDKHLPAISDEMYGVYQVFFEYAAVMGLTGDDHVETSPVENKKLRKLKQQTSWSEYIYQISLGEENETIGKPKIKP